MSNLNRKPNRTERKKRLFRIGAIILAVLMVGGTIYSAFAIFFMNAYAAYDEYAFSSETSTVPYITVGIVYGSDSPTAYPIRSPSGFVVGSVQANNDTRSFTPFFTLSQTTLTPAIDVNVAKAADGTYSPTDEFYQTKIGAYHIQLSANADLQTMLNMVPQIDAAVKAAGYYAFPAYINGVLYIRVGDFAAYNQTVSALNQIQYLFAGFGVEIVEPSDTTVSLIDPATDHIAFEYDCGEDFYMGLAPIQTGGTEQNYLQTPADNLYEGVFAASRYHTDTVNGITVFNVIDLEGYVEGILPYEVLSTWPPEALRANAIAIRSYALSNIGTHDKAYGFDLCTSHCMSYRGRNKVTDAIIEVVSSTEGEVLSYAGEVVNCFFSSSNGGEAISPHDAWGGTDPVDQIGAAKTPWERYTEHSNGTWQVEYTPSELAQRLRDRGHSSITGDIASITVNEYAREDSYYITSMTLTDVYGNSITLNTASSVQNTLGLKSANFMVGRGTVYYGIEEVQSITVSNPVGMTTTPTANGNYSPFDYFTDNAYPLSGASVYTASGIVQLPDGQPLSIMSATGVYDISGDVHLLVGDQSVATGTSSTTISPVDPNTGLITAETIHNGTLITTIIKPVIETCTASSPNNFIFAGKGWGHGVGLSQYGTYDLAKAGAKAETILELYFNGAKIVNRASVGW